MAQIVGNIAGGWNFYCALNELAGRSRYAMSSLFLL